MEEKRKPRLWWLWLAIALAAIDAYSLSAPPGARLDRHGNQMRASYQYRILEHYFWNAVPDDVWDFYWRRIDGRNPPYRWNSWKHVPVEE